MLHFRLALAVFGLVTAVAPAPARAADGCSYDWYGRLVCAPGARPGVPYYGGYRSYYEERPRYYDRGGGFYPGRREYYRGGPPSERRNGGVCPRGYTVQDGECKPYTGR
jgi:hypothetical protein